MMNELKPCPFCGSTRIIVGTPLPGVDMPGCLCLDCGGTIHRCYSTKDDAIAAWNRREGVKAQSRPLAYVPEMYELLKVWTQVGAEPMLMNARDTARKLLARIDGEEAEHEQRN